MKSELICGGCGEILTKEHWSNCEWVNCKCGHLRKDHDSPDGCTWGSGRGFRCPCEKFNLYWNYKEFYAWSERLMKLYIFG